MVWGEGRGEVGNIPEQKVKRETVYPLELQALAIQLYTYMLVVPTNHSRAAKHNTCVKV